MLSDEELIAELKREFHGGSLTQVDFASKIGIGLSTLHRMFNGKSVAVQHPTRVKIRTAFPRIAELDRM